MKNIIWFLLLFSVVNLVTYADTLPPLKKETSVIDFKDDLNFKFLLKAINRQILRFNKSDLSSPIEFPGRKLTRKHLYDSMLVFKKHVEAALSCMPQYASNICIKEFSRQMNRDFEAYRPKPAKWEKGYKTGQTFFTAYYSPDFEGSYTRTAVYKNPIYARPKLSTLQKLSSDDINFKGKLKNKGLELIYVKESLYDIWLLHVEGGGRVKIKKADGSFENMHISYTGANKQSFQMLFKYMLAQGMLVKGKTSIAEQREYFVNHPGDQRDILNSCPSFIFFELTKKEPVGVQEMELTEKRSLATDYRRVKEYGIINFIKTKKPVFSNGNVSKIDFSRFFINQDTGGAIKGNARVDLYFGYGRKAELAANYVYGLGDQYYLILK